jgi:hypothetical protein
MGSYRLPYPAVGPAGDMEWRSGYATIDASATTMRWACIVVQCRWHAARMKRMRSAARPSRSMYPPAQAARTDRRQLQHRPKHRRTWHVPSIRARLARAAPKADRGRPRSYPTPEPRSRPGSHSTLEPVVAVSRPAPFPPPLDTNAVASPAARQPFVYHSRRMFTRASARPKERPRRVAVMRRFACLGRAWGVVLCPVGRRLMVSEWSWYGEHASEWRC